MNIFSIIGCLILSGIMLLIGLILIRIAKVKSAKTLESDPGKLMRVKFTPTVIHKTAKAPYITGSIIGIIAIIFAISMLPTTLIAKSHGMQSSDFTKMSITSVWHGIANSPSADTLATDKVKSGDIIIYYKFGCDDCEAVYKDLKVRLNGIDDVYWICTQTDNGKELLESYAVTEVPSGVYIRHDTLSGNVPFSKFTLYTTDENDKTVLNTDNYYGLGRLLNMKENNK